MPIEDEVVEPTPEEHQEAVNSTVDDLASSLKLFPDESDAAPPEVSEETAEPAAKPEGSPPAIAEPPPVDAAPDTWRKEAKAEWEKLTPGLKDEIRKRENDVAKFVTDSKPALAAAKTLGEILDPHRDLFTKAQIAPFDYLKRLVDGHIAISTGPMEERKARLIALAQDIGVDLKQLAGIAPAAPTDSVIPPQIQQYIQGLEEKVRQLGANVQSVASNFEQRSVAELSEQIDAFAKDPAHPDFDLLADDIAHLIRTKAAPTLTDAYNLAVLRNPVTAAKRNEAEADRIAEEKAAKERERVKAARKAAGANIRSQGSGRVAPPEETIDDTLRSALATINSRNPH